MLITYNPDSSLYEVNYFYNGSNLKVFEKGAYFAGQGEFTTEAFIPFEDGARDERVRTVTRLDGYKIHHTHYSQYSDEKVEWNDFTAELTRIRKP